jgi:hypothetical protein
MNTAEVGNQRHVFFVAGDLMNGAHRPAGPKLALTPLGLRITIDVVWLPGARQRWCCPCRTQRHGLCSEIAGIIEISGMPLQEIAANPPLYQS